MLAKGVKKEIHAAELNDVFSLMGKVPWMILEIRNYKEKSCALIKTIFMREMLKCGVLIQSCHNISYAHTKQDICHVVDVYRAVFKVICDYLEQGSTDSIADGELIRPVFLVR